MNESILANYVLQIIIQYSNDKHAANNMAAKNRTFEFRSLSSDSNVCTCMCVCVCVWMSKCVSELFLQN